MTTVREARIEAALRAIQQAKKQAGICRVEIRNIDLAEAVVDSLFKPDPYIDNATMPEPGPKHQLQDRHGWPVCRCGITLTGSNVTYTEAEEEIKIHIETVG